MNQSLCLLLFLCCHAVAAADYVANEVCKGCHEGAYAEWTGSHHQLAMQPATANTVLGDFNDTTFQYFDLVSRFFRKGDAFYVNTEGPDGKLHDYQIKYTFGVDPLQQYLVDFPNGRVQSLTIAWDTRQKRWFHLYPTERIKADDPLHWSRLYQNWNMMCGECHTTNYKKNYDSKSDSYKTTFSEINVSCQSCHGPGQQHVSWAQRNIGNASNELPNKGFPVDLASRGTDRTQVEVCAQCHARRTSLKSGFGAGERFLDGFLPATLREGLYHADGQINDEVYEYGSFLQSRMYQAGVSCSDCHNAHSLKLKADGNGVCVQCHRSDPPPRFATLKKKDYDSSGHHFHAQGSSGAACVGCHMPSKTYMGVDIRRDHSMRVPRPDLTLAINTPNACNACHEDKTASWAAQKVSEWYGSERASVPHYGRVLAAARAGTAGLKDVIALATDAKVPVIVRASATELLQPLSKEAVQALLDLAYDDNPLLRHAAVGGFERLPAAQRFPAAVRLLNDEVALVRGEAARILADVPAERFNEQQANAFRQALAEYRRMQEYAADTPAAQLNLAVLSAKLNDDAAAQRHYETALQQDRYFLPARFNLANYYNSVGDNTRAVALLREGIALAPENGDLYYSLALVLAELEQLEDAAAAFGKAADLLPQRARIRYNYALALQKLDQQFAAATQLRRAYEIDNQDADIAYALVVFHAQREQWREALPYARRLVELVPNAPGPQQMLQDIARRATQ